MQNKTCMITNDRYVCFCIVVINIVRKVGFHSCGKLCTRVLGLWNARSNLICRLRLQPLPKVITSIYIIRWKSLDKTVLLVPRAYKAKLTAHPDDTNDVI